MTYLFTSNNTITGEVEIKNDSGNTIPVTFSTTSYDAFGRFRISEPFTLFDSSHRYADNGKFATSNTSNTSFSFQANTTSIDMVVNTTASANVLRESYRVFAYQPGKSLQILNTFVMNSSKANLRQRVGYFSTENGIFLEQSDDVYFVKRSKVTGSVVETKIAQSVWNIDTMDGTGPSGLTLNLAYPQVFWIDLEWLGVGTVRMGFIVNGQYVHCHSIHHANLSSSPAGAYMQTAILPVRYEIENTGVTASSSTLKQICSTVITEGGEESVGRLISKGLSATVAVADDHYFLLIATRLAPGKENLAVNIKEIDILNTNNTNSMYKIVYNPTFSSNLIWRDINSSGVQFAFGDGTIYASDLGYELATNYCSGNAKGTSSQTEIPGLLATLGTSISGTPDTIAIVARSFTSTDANMLASFISILRG